MRYVFICILAPYLWLTSCWPNSGTDSSSCTPNVIDEGLQLYVSELNSTTYQMQLCAAPNRASVFSVYGAPASASLPDDGTLDTSLSQRSPAHISDANGVGTAFQITFHSTDNYFAIFEDRDLGGGNYALDGTQVLVHAHRLPGR